MGSGDSGSALIQVEEVEPLSGELGADLGDWVRRPWTFFSNLFEFEARQYFWVFNRGTGLGQPAASVFVFKPGRPTGRHSSFVR
jgi:hypothetical protein